MDILELESISKIKISLDGIYSRLDTVGERITEHEEKII